VRDSLTKQAVMPSVGLMESGNDILIYLTLAIVVRGNSVNSGSPGVTYSIT